MSNLSDPSRPPRRVLIVGNGGREHALAVAIARSPRLEALFVAPGNAGTAEVATNLDIRATAIPELLAAIRDHRIDLAVIGPEAPLAAGVSDALRDAGIDVFGPSKAAAEIESSKSFMKELLAEANVPTAKYAVFEEADQARAWARERGAPLVIKADGLAAGKGVIIAETLAEAEDAITAMLEQDLFGRAGRRILIEEMLEGPEVSIFALLDGQGGVLSFGVAQDHKRVGEGDTGPNTGGMGAFSPSPLITTDQELAFREEIIRPVDAALRAAGRPFVGILFGGLMLTPDGPKVLEFNARMGDPEAQVILPRLGNDLLAVIEATVDGQLTTHRPLAFLPEKAVTVVMASKGYPGDPVTGTEIGQLPTAAGVTVYHAATHRGSDGRLIATGGRVLAVTALGSDLRAAQAAAYAAVDRIHWDGGFCRRDIASKALTDVPGLLVSEK